MIYVAGIGPGAPEQITPQVQESLEKSTVIVGYDTYIDLLKPLFPNKKFLSTPMRQEALRCRIALEEAKTKTVTMICSGDAGVYGMAGLLLELAASETNAPEVEILPGITAACSGGALLGAPLGHDFAVISLSDLLTPWEQIEKRLRAAGEGDFCICLYNPSSKKRSDYLRLACNILMESRNSENAAGWVRNIGRDGQSCAVMTLEKLREESVDMFTTVFIGNSQTKLLGGKMVTPRGYRETENTTTTQQT